MSEISTNELELEIQKLKNELEIQKSVNDRLIKKIGTPCKDCYAHKSLEMEDQDALKFLSSPIMQWISKKFGPHTRVVIGRYTAEVFLGEILAKEPAIIRIAT